jgi:ribonuclease HII
MKCVAGIDEAGLGPMLGPLVFGATLLRGPAETLADLRSALAPVVARDAAAIPHRLAIDDSKKLFAGRRSLLPLELTVLATLHPGAPLPTTLEEVVRDDGGEWPPWYAPIGRPVPRVTEPGLAASWRDRWPRELAERGVTHVASFVRPVLEVELNDCFRRRAMNKADAVLHCVGPILRRLAALVPDDDLDVAVDRLGGRAYYGEFLAATFPMRPLATLEETPTRSRYALKDGARTVTVTFEVDGDSIHFPVALASMGAKYVRELFVERLNAHFERRKPGLVATAGYHDDAQRWLGHVGDVLTADERRALVRDR